MDALEAIRIARLNLAMTNRICYSEKDRRYIDIGHTKQDREAADAYNKLAELAEEFALAEVKAR